MSTPRVLQILTLGLGLQWGCFSYDIPHLTSDTGTAGFFETVDSETGDTSSDQTTNDTNSAADTATETGSANDTADTGTVDTGTVDTDTVDTDTVDTDTTDTDTTDTDTVDTDTADTDTVDTDTADTDTVDTDTVDTDTVDTDTVDTDTVDTDTTDTDTVDTDTADTDTTDTDTVDTDTADTDTVDTDTVDTDTADTDTADTDTADTDTADTDTADTDTTDTDTVDTDTAGSGIVMESALLSLGSSHACAVVSAGAHCWGRNRWGQIGNGDSGSFVFSDAPVPVSGLGSNAVAISGGGDHSCSILTGGALQCWGHNADGQLGNGTLSEGTGGIEATPVAVNTLTSGVIAVSAGGAHTCALLDTGGVVCWGENDHGQVGNGKGETFANQLTPDEVWGLSSGAVAISSGTSHACAILASDGEVVCWGRDDSGQLGCAEDNTVFSEQFSPVFVKNIAGVRSISAGGGHTCAVLNPNGALKCWGWNNYGQLGDGTTDDINEPPATNTIDSGVVSVSAGEHHTCALLSSGAIQCWGRNQSGQLGDGSFSTYAHDPHPVPVGVTGISNAVAVSAGLSTSCALLETSEIKCWGDDDSGQVGNGPLTNFEQAFPLAESVIGIP